ncbi:2-isopropylmalate synthase [Denitratisoma sp. DHT3]|uniref:2-isopropylmalate synthase n=1 Tax=Denitratisoma sp. DHT3 TaxID=1981880 RepID=UPI001198A518|nr:2-isopropylmalate synthase [Denitratisoma sp. DHT3]QDX80289.1 2-isopropylmalate synthase [Denitratisoma sp. DHT3]
MLQDPAGKYRPFPPVALPDRQWPQRTITQAPVWMSTDLRDGNQALFEPMDSRRKLQMFHMLCDIGFKEIEVAFPSASQTDFDFVRTLIEDDHIPPDVTIEVLTQAREPLIRRTMESLRGARRAIVHVYNATSRPFREFVFGMSRAEVVHMAVSAVQLIKVLAEEQPETEWVLEYSPETFTATELDFALEICNAVSAAWDARPERKIILNLPTTVEIATPNVYADQIEWMHRHLERRDSVILSLHPHNDRGTAVAAAELALMAGADRVEGCLFGNGERTGNVDLLTLALNLHTQGVAPGLDFSDINAIARSYEQCTQLPVPPRHPYAGDLVFTAFSGSHQDAIHKGFARQAPDTLWEVPYLPIDPADLGRSYDSIIRINSQSGKGGVAYLMESEFGIRLPRRLQVDFSRIVQAHSDRHGSEVDAATLWALFTEHYLEPAGPFRFGSHQLFDHEGSQGIRLTVETPAGLRSLAGTGNGPIDAAIHALNALGIHAQVRSFEERSLGPSGEGGNARAYALIELADEQGEAEAFGAGIDGNIVTASLKALFSGINRLAAMHPPQQASQAA